ncbi:Predicted homoserine dehydrogenase, contains C-terminal SAF domain [Paracoccus halophilus]|uniref:Flagellar basal body P-ring biosynthesis protein FlgA n=1 Tax=Paracoccus halophilus TaxID=376733 RepID=A0A099F3Y3_9RHOB|nr:flagellar basal body P-ring biosynthesis protein FlgA [Paracoccus halophilus]KGJ05425.1 flagellar basal body P-ring biosynthesis protein FlgA [Paracoccus halophilus]SFA49170.1 Predicted homoserine dehydrogenase, contains C-terminal SAF domain [Paracoccus halophilus]
MNHLRYFAGRNDHVVECAIVGSGGFGRSFLSQARHVRGLRCRVAFDRDTATAAAALASVGHDRAGIAECTDAAAIRSAWADDRAIACADPALLAELPVEVVLEATGDPEAGARHARLAIEADKHVIMVTKETDSVVGPILARMAAKRGRVVSPVDGDQPSLLIGLASWAEVIGLDMIAAGKSSEYDFVYDPSRDSIASNGQTVATPGFGAWIEPADRPWPEVAQARAELAAALPQRAVPDLCEMTVVANALGLMPDRPDLHAPIARITEVADLMASSANGGLLQSRRVLDVFHCLRLPGEPSFAGGVFVTVACHDDDAWQMLADKGHVVARNGRTAMIGLPRHLLGLEAATSVFETALLGVSSGAQAPRPVIDLTAHADRDLIAGTLLTAEGHHHTIAHVSARMTPAMALSDDTPIPYYLAANRRLIRNVPAGRAITCADVELDERSELLRLRHAQDAVGDWS